MPVLLRTPRGRHRPESVDDFTGIRTACAPSQSAIQTVIAQTQQPQPTVIPVPTHEPLPTATDTAATPEDVFLTFNEIETQFPGAFLADFKERAEPFGEISYDRNNFESLERIFSGDKGSLVVTLNKWNTSEAAAWASQTNGEAFPSRLPIPSEVKLPMNAWAAKTSKGVYWIGLSVEAVEVTVVYYPGQGEALSDPFRGIANLAQILTDRVVTRGYIASLPPGYVKIEYQVKGSTASASLTYQNESGNTEQRDVSTPWTLTIPALHGQLLYVSAQNQSDSGTISCRIYANGVLIESADSEGAYVIASCNGSVP